MLEFIKETSKKSKGGHKYALYRCLECPERTIKEIRMSHVKDKTIRSCGCVRRNRLKTHGKSSSPEYRCRCNMILRCYDKNHNRFQNYNSKGIIVCPRWLESFENFYADMGDKPSPELSIERIDNYGNYCPENCKWGTDEEQSNNRTSNDVYKWNGKSQTLAQWSRELHIPRSTLWNRLYTLEWSIEKAFTTPNVLGANQWD